ncbi:MULTISPECIES: extracellular solute-binding protein [unclassified Actinomyces]|uniref:sugar ABC transporter substrate-binding protein n=1 Tax=unclassified Actinomyces TaxID=2609248 RepID=UPI002017E579|nr:MULTISPECIES: extracellular solute-binding protein [unclassified Actinomyces]MCL3777346.1 extracellular solute-binding protein [Actinomyces sp. AC-20-1]MCL3790480.1 extracellular solute-binding protein [Actinomyces sp. 187325]MCL3792748.1 extracellular solute-binding protein [Actinomyces sp. 186855]MCL3794948.1 extracellular solute-binding protein [Actinomyces sp. 217892]
MPLTRRAFGATALAAAVTATLAACGTSSTSTTGSSDKALTFLIAASGDAESAAYREAVAAFTEQTGIEVELQLATDLQQELAQGFAAGAPADVFYLAPDYLASYADNGSLYAYGDQLSNVDDFYPSLVANLTYDGVLYGAPKDFSTLGLFINTDLWAAAGLTEADYPKDWASLEAVAATLTSGGVVGLTATGEYARVGAFMAQAGGGLVSADGTRATASSDGSVAGLAEVKKLLEAGSMKFSADLSTGWGGEAFGTGLAAMAIEGNWLIGAMSADYPDVAYTAVELPAGPAGKGTMTFTNAYGIAEASSRKEDAVALVEFLTTTQQQLAFSAAFGVMPSIQSAADQFKADNPDKVVFLNGADYAISMPTANGASDVVADFNSQIASLATSDPKTILDSVQANLEAVIA